MGAAQRSYNSVMELNSLANQSCERGVANPYDPEWRSYFAARGTAKRMDATQPDHRVVNTGAAKQRFVMA
jgi:hypothetical protein